MFLQCSGKEVNGEWLNRPWDDPRDDITWDQVREVHSELFGVDIDELNLLPSFKSDSIQRVLSQSKLFPSEDKPDIQNLYEQMSHYLLIRLPRFCQV